MSDHSILDIGGAAYTDAVEWCGRRPAAATNQRLASVTTAPRTSCDWSISLRTQVPYVCCSCWVETDSCGRAFRSVELSGGVVDNRRKSRFKLLPQQQQHVQFGQQSATLCNLHHTLACVVAKSVDVCRAEIQVVSCFPKSAGLNESRQLWWQRRRFWVWEWASAAC